MSDGQQDNTEPQPSEDDTETTETTEAVAPNPAVPQILNVERFSVFNEGLLYYATKLLLKELKMDTGEGGAQSGDDADRELDSVMEFPEVRKPLNTPDEVLQYWNVCYEKETLSHLHFREWWRQKVPKIFNPIPSMNYQKPTEHIEEDDVKKYFFDLLERFLCNGDPSEVLKQLSSLNSPPAQCGKVFKMGEPTYSCRDCGLDPTCVLCVDCFKNSEHGSHRYKMSTSVGGGYCDCGDKEAWKDHPYCATHVLGTQANSSDPLAKVPLDIQLRARHVFTGVLKYAYELLTLDTFMKLPGDLQYKERDSVDPLLDDLLEVEDMYTTVLYNDEVHTFDQVIDALQRALDNCDRNLAISFVSLIDREGRSLVKCSSYQACNEVRRILERITGRRNSKPLKVMVIHSHVVAHQTFAMRLIGWLDSILAYSEGFRALFSRILVEQEVINGRKQPSILEGMLRHDTVLWKAARSAIHHLLISGMLLEHASKKEFATVFTNSYGSILKDFINDDHEHSYSVSSLSVQLFTVPTLAHYLIAKQDVLATLLRTFISECERKRNSRGKLEFERNLGVSAIRRANFVLIDLKYLLSIPPLEFDDDMRRGFLHGFSLLLEILTWMQNMDCHTRQINQHVEFEADWENGFNLHIKLAPVVALLLNWCSRDKVIFLKSYRMLLKKLKEETQADVVSTPATLEGHTTTVNPFSVATGPVSMHLPLSRLLAGLSLLLENFGMKFHCDDFKLLEHEMPDIGDILELPLRTAVMVSQVHAGMWRRNGYGLTHQIYFYHNSRCRGEMYDRDVQLVQFCAAHLPPDEFILHCLNKFNLINWASTNFEVAEEESIRHVTTLVEEFLVLMVTIVAERHSPGVGRGVVEDMVRQEIIQLLCVEPMSHSALNKALPEDVNHETGLERVIDQVATFKKPTGGTSTKGVYELKEEYYGEYNVFFYHFTREDQSKSEESQRQRLKTAGKPAVAPPPVPALLSHTFQGLASLLHSDLMLHLIKLVLDRADNLKSRCFSEAQVHKVLYLIGIGLMEQERDAREKPEEAGVFTKRALENGILEAMEKLVGSQRILSHKELLAWTVKKFRSVAGLVSGVKMEVSQEEDDTEEARVKRTKAAAERRKRIMAAMANQQKTFMTENAKLFEETPSGLREHKQSMCEWELEEDLTSPVCLGPSRSAPTPLNTNYTCILCQEEEQLSSNANTLVMASYVQRSTVLARRRPSSPPPSSEDTDTFPFLPSDLNIAPHTSSCGHVMHAACWQKYFDDVSESEKRRYRSRHPTSFDVEKQEFLCPLCRSLSNAVVPLIPQYHLLQQPSTSDTEVGGALAHESPDGESVGVADEAVGVAAVVEECDTMETTEELPPSPTPSSPLLLQEQDGTDEAPSLDVVTDGDEGAAHVAISSSVTVVSSPSTSTSSASSSSEFASATSASSNPPQETFSDARACERVKSEEVDGKRLRCSVNIDFSQWLEALFIALKYRRGLSRGTSQPSDPLNSGESQPVDMEPEVSNLPSLTRYYTCPLDQVVEEMDQLHHDGTSFSRLFMVEEGCELSFPTSVYEIMNSFSQTTYRVGLDGIPQLQDERLPLMVWQSCGFTVHSIVVSAMESEKPLFGSLSSRQNDCLSTFIRFCGVVGSNFGEPKVIRSHSLKLLSTLLESDPGNPSVFDIDVFSSMVSLTYSLPSLFNGEGPAPLPSCNIQDLHILRLSFLCHITQLLGSITQFSSQSREGFRSPPAKDCTPLLDLLQVVKGDPEVLNLDPAVVWQDVMVSSLGFLRASSLFYHYLGGVAAPVELTQLLPPDQEFAHLLKYLGLPPSPRHLLDSPFTLVLARRWMSHPAVRLGSDFSYVASVPQLIPLPQDYSELINSISSFTCPRSVGEESKMPSMCLICGTVVCSQSYCCQAELPTTGSLSTTVSVGACTAHSHLCGAGTGIFLRVRECKIVMFSGRTKGCYESPPYLDQYGETDEGLRRGNPLSLCPDRYQRLHRLWLNHGVAEKVTHNTEASSGFVTTEWINL